MLFSAAYAPESLFLAMWRKRAIRLVTSDYVVQEVERNLPGGDCRQRLERLLANVEIVSSCGVEFLPDVPHMIELPEKDQPILAAAINARATHLITGDRRHFGKYFGKRIRGVLIQTPAQYLRNKPRPPRGER